MEGVGTLKGFLEGLARTVSLWGADVALLAKPKRAEARARAAAIRIAAAERGRTTGWAAADTGLNRVSTYSLSMASAPSVDPQAPASSPVAAAPPAPAAVPSHLSSGQGRSGLSPGARPKDAGVGLPGSAPSPGSLAPEGGESPQAAAKLSIAVVEL
jgi:hypothetical protein